MVKHCGAQTCKGWCVLDIDLGRNCDQIAAEDRQAKAEGLPIPAPEQPIYNITAAARALRELLDTFEMHREPEFAERTIQIWCHLTGLPFEAAMKHILELSDSESSVLASEHPF